MNLHVLDTGNPDGPPIVWLGSLGTTTAMWDRQVSVFGSEHRCVLVDHPGHGESAPPDGPLSIESMADAVAAALAGVGVERADVVGLSLGGMVAMRLAADHGDRVDRLALLFTTASLGQPDAWKTRAETVRAEGMSSVAEAVVSRWLTPDYAAAHPEEVATLVAMVGSTTPEDYAACCEAIGVMDQRVILGDVKAPTLMVSGTLDRATPPEHGETIVSLIPDARMETVATAHLGSWEQPGAVNDLLRTFLDRGGRD